MKLHTVINFCTNDIRFIEKAVEEALIFSHKVIVVTCDHFFDGTKENISLLHEIYALFPEVTFIQYTYLPDRLYSNYIDISPDDKDWQIYWYSTSRYIGYLFGCKEADYTLFLDVDEIADGKKMKRWLEHKSYYNYSALRFLSYVYFRTADNQATTWTPNATMVKKSHLVPHMIFSGWDRVELFEKISGDKNRKVVGRDNKPLFHHYNWVRSKSECIKKASTSGHHWEKPWNSLIEKEFSYDTFHQDFAFAYDYQKAPVFFDPLSAELSQTKKEQVFPIYVTRSDALKEELEWMDIDS